MRYRKEIITTAGTLACAIGIGFFMQSTQPLPGSVELEGAPLANADAAVLDVEEIMLTSADFVEQAMTPEMVQETRVDEVPRAAPDMAIPRNAGLPIVQATAREDLATMAVKPKLSPSPACEITATARPVAAAMVNLTLDASCLPMERVTVHHSGLLFSRLTDAAGRLDVTVPAMAQNAVFVVAFSDGEGAVAQTVVEELADYDRVALQWKGDTGFSLHAMEFGADYGTEGHVYAQAPRDMTYAVTGKGGYISILGDANVPDGHLAQVYTFPTTTVQSAGGVDLLVEAEVGQNNCGLEIEAQTLQTKSGTDITTRNLTLSVPDCDAAGNFLVLNNLLEDLRVAGN